MSVDIPRYKMLADRGIIDLGRLINRVYRLDQINDAIDDMRSGSVVGRIVISMESSL